MDIGLLLKTHVVFAEQFNKGLMATDFKPHLMVEISYIFFNTVFCCDKICLNLLSPPFS